MDYNDRMFYNCFNNLFLDYCGSPDLDLPPITISDRPCPYKRARYTPDLLPYSIYVASEKVFSTLTTSSDSPQVLVLTSYDTNPPHAMNNDDPICGRLKIGYCSR